MREPVRVTIDRLDADGVGSGLDARGRRWTIRGGVPGSTVLAGGRVKHGALLDVVEPPGDATPPRCPLVGTCGGCLYQSLPAARQREEKLAALQALLAPLSPGGTIVGADRSYGYRNKIELSFGTSRYLSRAEIVANVPPESGRFLGFHGAGRFDRVVDVPECALASPAINAVLERVRRDTLGSPFDAYDARSHQGFWRHLVLREGLDGVLVLLYTALAGEDQAAWIARHAGDWGAAGVLWYTTGSHADAAVGELRAVVHGVDRLSVRAGGAPLSLSPTAFFQVNDTGAAVLLEVIRGALGEGGTLLDLYAGVGALGLSLADRFDEVLGVELNAEAVAEANRNAGALGLPERYLAGKAESLLPDLLRTAGRPLRVLVDPPRGGLHPGAMAPLLDLDADVLVYVACRPTSLARDGAALAAHGWRCQGWTAVDLFPHTAHVEVVASFVRERTG